MLVWSFLELYEAYMPQYMKFIYQIYHFLPRRFIASLVFASSKFFPRPLKPLLASFLKSYFYLGLNFSSMVPGTIGTYICDFEVHDMASHYGELDSEEFWLIVLPNPTLIIISHRVSYWSSQFQLYIIWHNFMLTFTNLLHLL